MKQYEQISIQTNAYNSLIALWVLCEAFVGGIFHAVKVPGSGLIVGGSAVVCICLIKNFYPKKGAILKAAIIVAVFKLLLSPHSPVTAYVALLFQGVVGEFLFNLNIKYKLASIILAFLALVESAIQRILILTIIYGTALWKAVNEFIQKLTGEDSINDYSLMIALTYIFLHAVAGIIIGNYAGNLPRKISEWKTIEPQIALLPAPNDSADLIPIAKKKSKLRWGIIIIWLILLTLYIQSLLTHSSPWLPTNLLLQILIRSILILLTWNLLIAPLTFSLLKGWLAKKTKQNQQQINSIFALLASTKYIILESWKITAHLKSFSRIRKWSRIVLVNVLRD